MITQENISITERITAPKPKLFRTIRTIGLTLLGVSTAIFAAPIALPTALITIAGYLATAGTVAVSIAQSTADFKKLNEEK